MTRFEAFDPARYIKKQELLKTADISYAKLYRWKREKLIPEAWFIKRACKTGQQTWLPKAKILRRIEEIRVLLQKYTIEEIAQIVNPDLHTPYYTTTLLSALPLLDMGATRAYMTRMDKKAICLLEVICLHILSVMEGGYIFSKTEFSAFFDTVNMWVKESVDLNYTFMAVKTHWSINYVVVRENSHILFDAQTKIVHEANLSDICQEIIAVMIKNYTGQVESDAEGLYNVSQHEQR